MAKFILRRFFTSFLALIASTVVVFLISRVISDPAILLLPEEGYGMDPVEFERLKDKLHLNDNVVVQYGYWISGIAHGDWGADLATRQPIAPKLKEKWWPTAQLALSAFIVATVFGIPLGIFSAVKRGTYLDLGGRSFAVLGQSLPTFWLGIVGIFIFAVKLGWLPSASMGDGFFLNKNLIMPTIVLAWLPMAGYTRLVRSAMLDVLDSEYIKLARSKGVSQRSVIWKHGFKNAILAPLTFGGVLLAGLITGSVAVETVFAWPGIARWAVEAVFSNNLSVLGAVTLVFTFAFIILNFIVDILYAFVDPRLRLT
jgi:peptide/nickel transport system permease protein